MRPIDADALKKKISDVYENKNIYQMIDEMPTVDAVQVVRCKDCKYYKVEGGQCPADNTGDRYYSWIPDPDWYCADGERRDYENG